MKGSAEKPCDFLKTPDFRLLQVNREAKSAGKRDRGVGVAPSHQSSLDWLRVPGWMLKAYQENKSLHSNRPNGF
jgi:hypothetical protein